MDPWEEERQLRLLLRGHAVEGCHRAEIDAAEFAVLKGVVQA